MSSADKSHQSPKSATKPNAQADAKTDSVSKPPSSAETKMDQPQDSPLTAVPPAHHPSSVTMSSTEESPSSESSSTPSSADHSPAKSSVKAPSVNDQIPAPEPPSSKEQLLVKPSSAKSPAAEPVSSQSVESSNQETAPQESVTTSAAQAQPQETSSAAGQVNQNEPTSEKQTSVSQVAVRQQPIPPASEPMQYRAIGLVRGKYEASEEQFTRGNLLTDDGFSIGAVLLGRVMSLVKKHLDLEQSHLWVVYPRTREKGDSDLHVQIVGVWEPEKLNRTDSPDGGMQSEVDYEAAELESELEDEAEAARTQDSPSSETEPQDAEPAEPAELETSTRSEPSVSATVPDPVAADTPNSTEALPEPEPGATLPSSTDADLDDKYFSVRGEIIYQSLEEERILVKIRRAPKPGTGESKAFKVALKGKLEGKSVGYFWDLNVQREGNELVVRDGTLIAAVPPQKRKSSGGRREGGKSRHRRPQAGSSGRKRWNGPSRDGQQQRSPSRSGDRPSPPQGRSPLPKPVIKRRNNPENSEG